MNELTLLDLLVLIGSVFGVTFLIRRTNGLFDVFLHFRIFMGKRHTIDMDEHGRIRHRTEVETFEYEPWHAKLIDCFWCSSTWVSGVIVILYDWIPFRVLLWFALVGFAGLIYTLVQFLNRYEPESPVVNYTTSPVSVQLDGQKTEEGDVNYGN